MAVQQSDITLRLKPSARLDVIDVTRQINGQYGDFLKRYPRALYYSYHTTAGYFEESICARLDHDRDSVEAFVQSFQQLFPPSADYRHDQLHLRSELTEEQRCQEPCNADSHLTFIGSGLTNSVTYRHLPETPVYFVDLDGVHGDQSRERITTVVGFHEEEVVGRTQFLVPVSSHPIDSVSLKDMRLGLFQRLQEMVSELGISRGRIDVALAADEQYAGLTVNEYETLLMKHDLAEVLRDPFRFMAEKGRHMLLDPMAIPSKAKDYAKYDLVRVVNEFVDSLGLRGTLWERIIDKFLAVPAAHYLQMKRSVSLLVSDSREKGKASIISGEYQSPVLVQWKKSEPQTRCLEITFIRLR